MDESISKPVAVGLILAITVLVSASIGSILFDLGSNNLDNELNSASFEVSENNVLKVNPLSVNPGSVIEVKKASTGNVLFTITDNDLGKIKNLKEDASGIPLEEGEKLIFIDVNNNKVIKEYTAKKSYSNYLEPPKDNLNKDNFKLVSQGFNQREFKKIEDINTRFVGTTEDFKVKLNKNYDPEGLTFDWGSRNSAADVIESNDNKAKYRYNTEIFNDENARVTIKNGNDTIKLSKTFKIERPIHRATIRSNGFNEKEFRTINNPNTRFVGTTETFEITNLELHNELDGYVDDNLSNFNLNWNSIRSSTNLVSEKNTKATYKYVEELDSSFNHVSLIINHKDSTVQREFIKAFSIDYAIQGINLNSVEAFNKNTGEEINYTGEENRKVGTNEKFELTNIILHNELDGYVDDSLNNFNYTWSNQVSATPLINEDEQNLTATYKYVEDTINRGHIRVTVKHKGSNVQRELYDLVFKVVN